jgi:hypothetical protein
MQILKASCLHLAGGGIWNILIGYSVVAVRGKLKPYVPRDSKDEKMCGE